MKEYSKSELESLLHSGDVKIVTDALLYLTFNVNDYNWVQEKCLQLFDSNNEDIIGLAITCLGHIARIYSNIDRDKVIPALKKKAMDTRFTGRIEDAIDDINMFAIKE
ncbi:hypothetical protein [Photorhabdus sp. SF281]|uniref:hypothetical protein n=1 Tax=Photorhabdus sp. SF281 TaxID=3459527 RepID=UPI0040443977